MLFKGTEDFVNKKTEYKKTMRIYFLFVLFTQNNIFLSLTNNLGEVLNWKSIGTLKTKGLKKLTNSILKNFVFLSLEKIINLKNAKVHIKIKGFNKCKKNVLKLSLNLLDKKILSISDNLLKSMNGCKIKRKRRL